MANETIQFLFPDFDMPIQPDWIDGLPYVSTILNFKNDNLRNKWITQNLFDSGLVDWNDRLQKQPLKTYANIDEITIKFKINVKEYAEMIGWIYGNQEGNLDRYRQELINKTYVIIKRSNLKLEGYWVQFNQSMSDQGNIGFYGYYDIALNTILDEVFNENEVQINRGMVDNVVNLDNKFIPNIHVDSLGSLPEDIDDSINENVKYQTIVEDLTRKDDIKININLHFRGSLTPDEQREKVRDIIKNGFTVYYVRPIKGYRHIRSFSDPGGNILVDTTYPIDGVDWSEIFPGEERSTTDKNPLYPESKSVRNIAVLAKQGKNNNTATTAYRASFYLHPDAYKFYKNDNTEGVYSGIYASNNSTKMEAGFGVFVAPNFWMQIGLYALDDSFGSVFRYKQGRNDSLTKMDILNAGRKSILTSEVYDKMFNSNDGLIMKTKLPFTVLLKDEWEAMLIADDYSNPTKFGIQIGNPLGKVIDPKNQFGFINGFSFGRIYSTIDKGQPFPGHTNDIIETVKNIPVVLYKWKQNSKFYETGSIDIYKNFSYNLDINEKFIPNNIGKMYKSPYSEYIISSFDESEYVIKPEYMYDQLSFNLIYSYSPFLWHVIIKPKTVRDTLYNSDFPMHYYFQDVGENSLYQTSNAYSQMMMENRLGINLEARLGKRNQALKIAGSMIQMGSSIMPNAGSTSGSYANKSYDSSNISYNSSQIGGLFSGISQMITSGDELKKFNARIQDIKNTPNKISGNAGDFYFVVSNEIIQYSLLKSTMYKINYEKTAQFFNIFGYNLSSMWLKLKDYLDTRYWWNYIEVETPTDIFKNNIGSRKKEMYRSFLKNGGWLRHYRNEESIINNKVKDFNKNNVEVKLLGE